MDKKISKFALSLARKKVLQIGFLSLFIFLAFFNFTLAQDPGWSCGDILSANYLNNDYSGGEIVDSCVLAAACSPWDTGTANVGFCYIENLTAASYCVSTINMAGDDLQISFGENFSRSVCVDSPTPTKCNPCGGLLDFCEIWTWSGSKVINEVSVPGSTTWVSTIKGCVRGDSEEGNCTNIKRSEVWKEASIDYTYKHCCPDGYTYDDSGGTEKCVGNAGTDCAGSGGECCVDPQVCPIGQRITGKTGCTHPEKCCNPGECINSDGTDCIVDDAGEGAGVCCDTSASACYLPKAGSGCATGTTCCDSGHCVPNSPAVPTDPTEDPAWVPVSWTPLVDIPGMPTGKAPLGGYIVALYNFLLGSIGIIAMMMLVFGGFRYMTSAGNPTAMGDAKDIVYSAIIGLTLALVSFLIIKTINPELLFTQDPKLAPFGSPKYSENLPANSCSYNLSGFEPDHCRCIGDVDGEGGDTTCEFNKSDYDDYYDGWCDKVVLNCGSPIIAADDGCKCGTITVGLGDVGSYCCAGTNTLYPPDPPPFLNANETCLAACAGHDIDTNTCSGMCKSIFCAAEPKCCIKVDLRVGTTSLDVTHKSVEINAGALVFFDALGSSYSCKYPITAVSIDAKSNWWAPFQDIAEYEERIGDYPCRCGIGTKGTCDNEDEWCKAKPGRFVYKFDDVKTYYPKLRICVGADEGGHLCTDITEGEKTHDEAVTVIVK